MTASGGWMTAAWLAAQVATPTPLPSPTSALPPPVLSIKQLTLPLPLVDSPERKMLVERFRVATQGIASCVAADQVAKEQGATVIANNAVPFQTVPKGLQDGFARMPVGRATPLGSGAYGVRVFVLCARD